MWHSQSIVSLKATKSIFEYLCISPFQGRNRFQYIYYILVFLVYAILFLSAFYSALIYTDDLRESAENYDTIFILSVILNLAMGPCFGLGIIFSLCSRSAQLKLQNRMSALDIKIKSHLRVEPSFRRLNIEFVTCCVLTAAYFYGDFSYFVYIRFNQEHFVWRIHVFCGTFSAVYFYLYGFYTTYWARVYINRSKCIIDALETATSQKFISKPSLSIILELINLLFDVRESIQDAFGPILFMIIFAITIGSAESSSTMIHVLERQPERKYYYLDYGFWFLVLWSELTFIFVSFNKIGNVVSECT